MNNKKLLFLTSVLALSGPTSAFAGGVALPARGVRAMSVGGAFVASADGVNALWANPAQLGLKSQATVEVGLVALSAKFTAENGEVAENLASPTPNPTLGVLYNLGEHLTLGVGAFAPYSAQHKFDEKGPQRYALIESHNTTLLYLAGGLSFHYGPVRIGATIQNVMAHIRQQTVLSGYVGLFGTPTDPELDIVNELELRDDFTLTGNIGMSIDLGPVTIGGTVQLPYTVEGQADFRVRLPSSVFFDSTTITGDKVDFAVPFPLMVRGGIAWRVNEELLLEASFNWEEWSIQDRLVIDPKGQFQLAGVPSIGDYELPALFIDRRMKDTLSLHLGGDYLAFDNFNLRAGGFYEQSAFPDQTYSVAQLDGDKLGLSMGASYLLIDAVRLEFALAYIHQFGRTINNSELRQINPTNPEQTVVVGNGTHESGLFSGGLGVTWLF